MEQVFLFMAPLFFYYLHKLHTKVT